jgi:hypothetical protein
LAIFATCCQKRKPLIEVMETNPSCVVMRVMAKYTSEASTALDEGAERRTCQGATQARGDLDVRWLSTCEPAATPTKVTQSVWCRHKREPIHATVHSTANNKTADLGLAYLLGTADGSISVSRTSVRQLKGCFGELIELHGRHVQMRQGLYRPARSLRESWES